MVLYGSYSVSTPDPVTADFIMAESDIFYYLNGKENKNVFLTILSRGSEMASVVIILGIGDTTKFSE